MLKSNDLRILTTVTYIQGIVPSYYLELFLLRGIVCRLHESRVRKKYLLLGTVNG
jgi:hypothetical protein